MDIFTKNKDKKRLVIVGCGFGGLELALRLKKGQFEVLLLDKNNYFTFQPLLYQVATGGLEPDSIAYPIRKIFSKRKDIHFRMALVVHLDAKNKEVQTDIGYIPYDLIVLASGSASNYFGMKDVQDYGLTMKSLPEALDLRSTILQNFERALLETDENKRKEILNLVVVGAGPTGVEIAGALAELRNQVLPEDYPELDIGGVEIFLLEAGSKALSSFSEQTSISAAKHLIEMGVILKLNSRMKSYNGKTVQLESGETINSHTLIWTAGVKGNLLNVPEGAKVSKANRLIVNSYNKVEGLHDVFAIGDLAEIMEEQGGPHPMLAPVAIQQAKNLASNLKTSDDSGWKEFKYHDKGTMATIGRSRAVAEIQGLRLNGFVAWLAWLFIHLMLLVGFRNRVIVFINWVWNYFSYDRAIRLIIRPYHRK